MSQGNVSVNNNNVFSLFYFQASRKISKCGYLFVAPEQFDFSNPLDKTRVRYLCIRFHSSKLENNCVKHKIQDVDMLWSTEPKPKVHSSEGKNKSRSLESELTGDNLSPSRGGGWWLVIGSLLQVHPMVVGGDVCSIWNVFTNR